MAQFQFNAREVEPDQGRIGAIPAGWYKTMITKTELKPNNDGTGRLIAVNISVLEGPYKGSTIFNNFNVENPSEKATEIGRKQLSALCHAVNVMNMTDTDQLKNIPFYTRVKLTPAVMENGAEKYPEKNEPTAFRDVNDQAAIAAAAKTASTPIQGAASTQPSAPAAFTPPPVAQQFQAPVQQFAPPAAAPMQQAPYQAPAPAAAPAPQYQPAPQAAPAPAFQPAPVPGQPDWAAAPAQPWGAAPAAAPAAGHAPAPVMTPEQQAAYAASQAAPVPWGAPQ